jgi:hypothetical protein
MIGEWPPNFSQLVQMAYTVPLTCMSVLRFRDDGDMVY